MSNDSINTKNLPASNIVGAGGSMDGASTVGGMGSISSTGLIRYLGKKQPKLQAKSVIVCGLKLPR
jgi:hypothetical protein